MSLVLSNQQIGPYQVLPFRVRVDLGTRAMRGAPHSPRPQHYWNLTIRLFSVISRTLVRGESYPSSEVQSVYSIAPADWAMNRLLKQILYSQLRAIGRPKFRHKNIKRNLGIINIPLDNWQYLYLHWKISRTSRLHKCYFLTSANFLTHVPVLSSSSCRAASTDIPDSLSPLLPIIHRFWQVFRATSRILT